MHSRWSSACGTSGPEGGTPCLNHPLAALDDASHSTLPTGGVESGAHRESESELFETPPPELAPFAAVRMQNLRKEFKSCWRGTTVAVDGVAGV